MLYIWARIAKSSITLRVYELYCGAVKKRCITEGCYGLITMFISNFSPRFYETDAFGHVNNTVVTGWFETAREPIFRIFTPEMNVRELKLILARVEVDFVAQIYYGSDVTVKTTIEKIGNSSFTVAHVALQNDIVVANGKAVQVYFDFDSQKSERIPDGYRVELEKHLEG